MVFRANYTIFQITQHEMQWRAVKSKCERSLECQGVLPDEALNCVNNCTSPVCFQEVYGSNPLEDGEIDTQRAHEFAACNRREMRLLEVMFLLMFFRICVIFVMICR